MCDVFTLENVSNIISIATPIILLAWFYYSQRQTFSQNYFNEVGGIYSGFTEPISQPEHGGRIYGGIILNIREIDGKGFFKGDFDFAESELYTEGGVTPKDVMRREGIHSFMGKLDFQLYRNRARHPYDPKANRKYKGRLYIVGRLDFNVEHQSLDMFLIAEYEIIHLREMGVLQFRHLKTHKTDAPALPTSFTLHRKIGSSFEPYLNVKEVVFHGRT